MNKEEMLETIRIWKTTDIPWEFHAGEWKKLFDILEYLLTVGTKQSEVE